ncbi:zinc finger protein 271-like [Onthophagus taurus]|uniref:zinc finger protein 271-like n=1 Tax=Onthophagus taurus TaxID=166361 RepID=UPI000C1FFA0A|nr:zinc finger protein 436-like [Onthophagus taurus]XP_022902390.1 zinc finger protein 436-like [Onthophagus taurus]
MESKYTDLTRLCRTCKMESSDMRPLHTRDTDNGTDNPRVDDMLMLLTNIKVEESDKLPHLICNYCVTQLKAAVNFKQLCEATDLFYKDLLNLNIEHKIEIYEDMILSEDTSIKQGGDNDNLNNRDYIQVLDDENILILTCGECLKVFTTIEGLKCHKRIHSKDPFKCKYCGREYLSLKSLNRHELMHTKRKLHVCKICNITISRDTNLKKHLMVHLKDRPYQCEGCTKGFNRSEDLDIHKNKCKGQKIYTCNICAKGFNREDSCMVHEKMHEDQQYVLPTLESLDNIQEFYYEVDLNDENINLINSEISDVDVEEEFQPDIACEVLFTPTVDKNPIIDIKSEIYAEEDPLEIMEEKARIEEEMYNGNSDSAESEYFPLRIKKKKGRPRKKPLKRLRGRPKKLKSNENNEHTCPDCKQVFPELSLLEDHMIKHECTYCKKRFARFTHLRRHILTHSESKPYPCAQCEKSFTRLDHLQQHIKVHDPEYRHSCESCGLTFSRQSQLSRHMVTQHNAEPSMQDVEKKFYCNICLKGFTTEKYRNVHVKNHEAGRPFQCNICKKTFTLKSHLNEHIKFHSESSKKFLCSECGQRFIRNDYLIIHMRRHRGEKPFKCKFCGKGFPRTTDLHVHERYHTGEKTHLCGVCGRGFGRAYNLRVHMRTHTGEKPYQCTYCPAAFAQGNDLKAHVRRHTGERFQCDLCEETFLMGYLLTQHKRSVHGLNIVGNVRRLTPMKKYDISSEEPETVSLPEPVILSAALRGTRLQTEVKME